MQQLLKQTLAHWIRCPRNHVGNVVHIIFNNVLYYVGVASTGG